MDRRNFIRGLVAAPLLALLGFNRKSEMPKSGYLVKDVSVKDDFTSVTMVKLDTGEVFTGVDKFIGFKNYTRIYKRS